MTTVAETIEWFKKLPQDAEVEWGIQVDDGYDAEMVLRPVDFSECLISDEGGKTIVKFAGHSRERYSY